MRSNVIFLVCVSNLKFQFKFSAMFILTDDAISRRLSSLMRQKPLQSNTRTKKWVEIKRPNHIPPAGYRLGIGSHSMDGRQGGQQISLVREAN